MTMHIPEIYRYPLALPFWLVFFLVFVRESRVVRQAFNEKSVAQDAGTFRVLMIGSPLAMLVAAAASFLPWAALPFQVAAVWLGMALIIAGGILRRICFNTLGRYFTGVVVVADDQKVIQHGVYRRVRHPSYTAALLMYIGLGVAMGNWISLAILFVAHCYLYGRRVVAEERALLETLGTPYREYMARTKRFIPFVI